MSRLTENEIRLWKAFLGAYGEVVPRIEASIADGSGLTLGELEVLDYLLQSDGRLRMAELADMCKTSRSGLTRRVDRLREKDMVQRVTASEDRRGAYAVITETGRSAAEESMPRFVSSMRSILVDKLDPSQILELTELLEHLGQTAHTIDLTLDG